MSHWLKLNSHCLTQPKLYTFSGTPVVLSLISIFTGRKKETRLGSNFFIIALAATDLLASILMPLLHIPGLLSKDGRWYFGASICKLLPTFSPMTLIVSAWTLVLIAGDRYRWDVRCLRFQKLITHVRNERKMQ